MFGYFGLVMALRHADWLRLGNLKFYKSFSEMMDGLVPGTITAWKPLSYDWRYDVQTDSIVFANNQPYNRDSYSLAGMGETIEDLLRFCRMIYAMKVDNAEYALLTAIVIFSGESAGHLVALWCQKYLQTNSWTISCKIKNIIFF